MYFKEDIAVYVMWYYMMCWDDLMTWWTEIADERPNIEEVVTCLGDIACDLVLLDHVSNAFWKKYFWETPGHLQLTETMRPYGIEL